MTSDWLYRKVRVTQVMRSAEEYDGWLLNQRAPRIGDTGYVVDILQAVGLPDHYLVEASQPDGITVWLSEFTMDELELIADERC